MSEGPGLRDAVTTVHGTDKEWGLGFMLQTYGLLLGARVRSQMQYRFSMIAEMVGFFLTTFLEFCAILVTFSRINALGGWSLGEVAVLYGLSSMGMAMAELLGSGFDNFSALIRQGQFDTLLVRPISDFMQVLTADFVIRRIGRFLQGLIVLGLAFRWLNRVPQFWQLVLMAEAVFCGFLLYMSLFIVQAAACFWSVEGLEVFNILTFGSNEAMSHPLEIYGRWLQRFLTFVIPMVFINYLPVRLILGKPDLAGLYPNWTGWLAPLVGLVAYLLARRVWDFGVSHYQSTGS